VKAPRSIFFCGKSFGLRHQTLSQSVVASGTPQQITPVTQAKMPYAEFCVLRLLNLEHIAASDVCLIQELAARKRAMTDAKIKTIERQLRDLGLTEEQIQRHVAPLMSRKPDVPRRKLGRVTVATSHLFHFGRRPNYF
jgi:hypothetical protein